MFYEGAGGTPSEKSGNWAWIGLSRLKVDFTRMIDSLYVPVAASVRDRHHSAVSVLVECTAHVCDHARARRRPHGSLLQGSPGEGGIALQEGNT